LQAIPLIPPHSQFNTLLLLVAVAVGRVLDPSTQKPLVAVGQEDIAHRLLDKHLEEIQVPSQHSWV
jgi:hypothetical protein